jgi:hypothetical protein
LSSTQGLDFFVFGGLFLFSSLDVFVGMGFAGSGGTTDQSD